jgi:hypothetical protein
MPTNERAGDPAHGKPQPTRAMHGVRECGLEARIDAVRDASSD